MAGVTSHLSARWMSLCPPAGESARHGQPAGHHRARRNTASDVPDGCELREFKVNLQTIGIATALSAEVNIFRCIGRCQFPFAKGVKRTSRAAAIGALHSLLPALHPAPCCSPSKLGNLEVLINADDGVRMTTFTGIVAEECACQ